MVATIRDHFLCTFYAEFKPGKTLKFSFIYCKPWKFIYAFSYIKFGDFLKNLIRLDQEVNIQTHDVKIYARKKAAVFGSWVCCCCPRLNQ